MGSDKSTFSLGPGDCKVSRFITWSPVAARFPDSPRCEYVPHADCAGGVPVDVIPEVLLGKTGAADGGGGMRVATARCGVCLDELA